MKKILLLSTIFLLTLSSVNAEEKYNLSHWKTENRFKEFSSPDGKHIAFVRKSDKEAYLVIGVPEDYSPEDRLADPLPSL